MADVIPFFYYDILARIIPGVMVLAVLRYGGLRIPEAWTSLLTGGWGTVIAPLVLAGAAHAIGVLFEATSNLPGLHGLFERVSNRAFKDAFDAYKWLNPASCPDFEQGGELKSFRNAAWNWLTLEGAEKPLAFAHAHRFQAEMKLCRHALLPAAGFVVLVLLNHHDCSVQFTHCKCWYFGLGLVVTLLLAWGTYARERHRWLQVLISVDHLQWPWPPRLSPDRPAQLSATQESERKKTSGRGKGGPEL
jgi:hypothetical protein